MNSKMIEIEDYYPHCIMRRYGEKLPPHEGIEKILSLSTEKYRKLFKGFSKYKKQLSSIEREMNHKRPSEPFWMNAFIPPLDAISLFGLISDVKPNLYLEIGSGNSTKFAAKAIQLNSPSTKIISIDPHPRSEIDNLCDEIIRKPLEDCDLSVFDRLSENDLLFFDGTHRLLQNSDSTVFFMEVFQRIMPNVYIQMHDIFWPFDYPDQWKKRMYSEQYALGVLLLNSFDSIEVTLPNCFISWRTELANIFDTLWNAHNLSGIDWHGCSFWFKKVNLRKG